MFNNVIVLNIMTEPLNKMERAIIEMVQEKTNVELNRRVPEIPLMNHRRLFYCLIKDRIAAYKNAGIKRNLDEILVEFGVTKKAYYAWHEKYHLCYKQCKII